MTWVSRKEEEEEKEDEILFEKRKGMQFDPVA